MLVSIDTRTRTHTHRTMDKKKTLLHVLMIWAKDKEPDLLLMDQDLEHASEASNWSLTDLKQQVCVAGVLRAYGEDGHYALVV